MTILGVGGEEARAIMPCPFCGGTPEMVRRGTMRQSMIIGCSNCGARVESGDVVGMTSPAEYAWNRRALSASPSPTPQQDAVREALEAACKLANEVAGLNAFEAAIREVISNTNFAVLMQRESEVRTALARLSHPIPESDGC